MLGGGGRGDGYGPRRCSVGLILFGVHPYAGALAPGAEALIAARAARA